MLLKNALFKVENRNIGSGTGCYIPCQSDSHYLCKACYPGNTVDMQWTRPLWPGGSWHRFSLHQTSAVAQMAKDCREMLPCLCCSLGVHRQHATISPVYLLDVLDSWPHLSDRLKSTLPWDSQRSHMQPKLEQHQTQESLSLTQLQTRLCIYTKCSFHGWRSEIQTHTYQFFLQN